MIVAEIIRKQISLRLFPFHPLNVSMLSGIALYFFSLIFYSHFPVNQIKPNQIKSNDASISMAGSNETAGMPDL